MLFLMMKIVAGYWAIPYILLIEPYDMCSSYLGT